MKMTFIYIYFSAGVLLFPSLAMAQLAVVVSPPKIAAQKAMVELKMHNGFAEKIESARAICFLLDDQGKMIGQSAKWVIGQNKIGLEPDATNIFDFVVTSPRSLTTTNLTAKVTFSRLILNDGMSANPSKDVVIEQQLDLTNQISPINHPVAVASKPLDSVIASASSPITVKPLPKAASAVIVTNSLRPINSQNR